MGIARYQTLSSVHPNFSWPSESRATIYLAAAVAALSAALVFFVLCERDHSLLMQTSTSTAPPIAVAKATTAPAQPAAPEQVPPSQSESLPRASEIPFTVTRSKHFHRVGPVSLGFWRIDPRRGTFDLSVLAYGRRINKNRVKVHDVISIDGKDPGKALKLIVESADRNEISGYLTPAE